MERAEKVCFWAMRGWFDAVHLHQTEEIPKCTYGIFDTRFRSIGLPIFRYIYRYMKNYTT